MADITPVRQNIPLPGSQFLAAVSEYFAQSAGGSVNFQNYFAHEIKEFFLNGPYNVGQSLPQVGVDGLAVFEFNAQIVDVWLFNLVAGSSGNTSIDLKLATSPGGSFSSIFTTPPVINFAAGNNVWVGSVNPSLVGSLYSPSPPYSPPANTTQGVLNSGLTNLVPAWSALRCDLLSVQGGSPQNCGILVHYRPV
jgi:hypothetical protein